MAVNIFKWLVDPLVFALPFYLANVVALLTRKVKFLDIPVDFNKKFQGKPVFGSHKTIRGLLFGTVAAGLVSLILGSTFYRGLILGFSSMLGDLFGAFLKRRSGISPGKKAYLYDKVFDMVFPILAAALFDFLPLSFLQTVYLLIFSIALGNFPNLIWYKLGLKENPW